MTDAEIIVWQHLCRRNMEGHKFRRQAPMGQYIVDFVCHEIKLIIEIEGSQHFENINDDNQQTAWLNQQGYKVIRFWSNDVILNLDGIKEMIWNACQNKNRMR